MNETQTRHDKIDPALAAAGWGEVGDSYVITEYVISEGRVSATAKRKKLKADYVLRYKGAMLAVVEAKSDELPANEGVEQAKLYAGKLQIRYTYATNGDNIYAIDMQTGEQGYVRTFPTPDELWHMTFPTQNEWRDKFNAQPFASGDNRKPRYYQEVAIQRVLDAISEGKTRILLTLATGTGKTYIASQIAHKLFQTKWNSKGTGYRPKILFLAHLNILANQAFNDFSNAFKADALKRIKPDEIRKDGKVPTNGSVFFTIFQTFLSGEAGYFGQYPPDFFDLVIVDECHRGGANEESTWRTILEYFQPAVQLGLTATPKRDNNVDTYRYFGEQVYQYSLKEGINEGYLTPFRHCKMTSTIDEYVYTPEDTLVAGEAEAGDIFGESDFASEKIIIEDRDFARVKEFLHHIKPNEKTLVFCYSQAHAARIRDMINYCHKGHPDYCVRVTSSDEEIGESHLKDFQDNEKVIPTILTTSKKLSTGVDARNVRNIVLLRPIRSMIEFKQIVGRGTRLYDGKYYFTIYDFARAYEHFADPEWDGEPVCPKCKNSPCTCGEPCPICGQAPCICDKICPECGHYPCRCKKACPKCGNSPCTCERMCPRCGQNPCVCPEKQPVIIKLSDGSIRKIQHIKMDMLYGADGKPVSVDEFLSTLFGKLPDFFSSAKELKEKWSMPETRVRLLDQLDAAGYSLDTLKQVRSILDADGCDILDILEYIAYNIPPLKRAVRASLTRDYKLALPEVLQDFIDHITECYIEEGVEALSREKLPILLNMKYGSLQDGMDKLGDIKQILRVYYGFQRVLYA